MASNARGLLEQVRIEILRRGRTASSYHAFLASDESSYITGIDLAVDGGMTQV